MKRRGKKGEIMWGMGGLVDRLVRGLEVPLGAFWCKARGGGGRLRDATER